MELQLYFQQSNSFFYHCAKSLLHSFLDVSPTDLCFLSRFPIPSFILFSPFPSPSLLSPLLPVHVLHHPFLSVPCQPLMLALTVSRLQSQEGDLQESKMARHGRSSQCHNTQRTLSGHARINRTSIHHLTCLLGLWRGLVHPRCMSEGFCGKQTFLMHLWATTLILTSSQNFLIYTTYKKSVCDYPCLSICGGAPLFVKKTSQCLYE